MSVSCSAVLPSSLQASCFTRGVACTTTALSTIAWSIWRVEYHSHPSRRYRRRSFRSASSPWSANFYASATSNSTWRLAYLTASILRCSPGACTSHWLGKWDSTKLESWLKLSATTASLRMLTCSTRCKQWLSQQSCWPQPDINTRRLCWGKMKTLISTSMAPFI